MTRKGKQTCKILERNIRRTYKAKKLPFDANVTIKGNALVIGISHKPEEKP